MTTSSIIESVRSRPPRQCAPRTVEPLCPHVIASVGSECSLVVPSARWRAARHVSSVRKCFEITDTRGTCVLLVELCVSDGAEAILDRVVYRLLIKSAQGESLAQCRAAGHGLTLGTLGRPSTEFHIVRGSGNYFATLVPLGGDDSTTNGYSVETIDGSQYKIQGLLKGHSLQMRDAAERSIAKATPCRAHFDDSGEHYLVRCAPLADVGLIIGSFLSLDYLGQGLV